MAATWSALDRELMRRRHVRRWAVASGAAVVLFAIVSLVAPHSGTERVGRPAAVRPVGRAGPGGQSTPARPIEIVQAPRLRVRVELLDDESLLYELAHAGYERSLVRVGSTVRVAFAPRPTTAPDATGGSEGGEEIR